MAQHYDHIIKENIQSLIVELLRTTTDVQLYDYQVVYPEFPQTFERTADFVIRTTNATGEKELIHLEFQTANDSTMHERMLLYYALLFKIYALPVRQFVFYIGKAPVNMQQEIRHKNLQFSYQLVNLQSISYREFLYSDNPEMVILAILTDFEDKEAEWIVEQILTKIKALDTEPAKLLRHVRQLDILSVLRNLQNAIINQEKKMGLSLHIENDLRFKQGKEEGKIEGKIEGKREGMQESKVEMVAAMFANGLSIAMIQKITELPVSEIEQIIRSHTKLQD